MDLLLFENFSTHSKLWHQQAGLQSAATGRCGPQFAARGTGAPDCGLWQEVPGPQIAGCDRKYRGPGLQSAARKPLSTFGISCEDCYARELSRFVCNKVQFFKLDDDGNCIIRKTWLHCI